MRIRARFHLKIAMLARVRVSDIMAIAQTFFSLLMLSFALSSASPLVPRQFDRAFALISRSADPSLNNRYIAENSSTDFGSSLIVLAPKTANRTAPPTTIVGFFLQQLFVSNDTYFLVDFPMRSGGSEFDGWVVGSTNSSGLATPSIVPAGGTAGWGTRNVTRGREMETRLVFDRAEVVAEFLGTTLLVQLDLDRSLWC